MSLDTQNDRTLFFDLLPITLTTNSQARVRLKLFTVPGQVIHDATRRLVLQGADGIAFIADSQKTEHQANQQAFLNMRENLDRNGMSVDAIPLVLQFNKRDLPGIRSDEEIDRVRTASREPVFSAIAVRDIGVLETFLSLLELTWTQLETTHQLEEKFGFTWAQLRSQVGASLSTPPPPIEVHL